MQTLPYGDRVISDNNPLLINRVYFIQGEINYPSGYNGLTPPSTPNVPVVSDHVPKFYVSTSNDWMATIHDTNFNTFDDNPFLCSEDLAPVLNFEIWDKTSPTESLLISESVSATAQITYQLPKNDYKQEFRIIGWYDCGAPPEIQFTESNFFDFTITKTGLLYSKGIETCITDQAPWIDFNSCIIGINDSLALLSFNAINPQNDQLMSAAQSNSNACYNMGTLGNWINRPSQTLCPAFSSEVRNIVTPFIVFILASTVFFYISRGARQVI